MKFIKKFRIFESNIQNYLGDNLYVELPDMDTYGFIERNCKTDLTTLEISRIDKIVDNFVDWKYYNIENKGICDIYYEYDSKYNCFYELSNNHTDNLMVLNICKLDDEYYLIYVRLVKDDEDDPETIRVECYLCDGFDGLDECMEEEIHF